MLCKTFSFEAEIENLNEQEKMCIASLRSKNMADVVISNFLRLFKMIQTGETGEIREKDINPVADLTTYQEIKENDTYRSLGRQNLGKVAMIKLNGGLGTGMGLEKAKNFLEVKPGFNFFDVFVNQVIKQRELTDSQIPLILMNSFSTDKDTSGFFTNHYPDFKNNGFDISFVQNMHPKIRQDNLEPAEGEFNPPGHGDIYTALEMTGMLDSLIDNGIEYAFISNGDNLGATVDENIVGYMIDNKLDFLMETAERTPADKKGGHLAVYKESGRYVLRESAQCHSADEDDFQNTDKHTKFNTNNIWINLKSLKKVIRENNGVMPLPLIRNPKELSDNTKVYQIETAMGAAIELFENSGAIVIDKERFAPVKKTTDLLALQSDIYDLDPETYNMAISTKRTLAPILISLEDKYYKSVESFKKHFLNIPSLINASEFNVKGNFIFGPGLAFIGAVSVINNSKKPYILRDLTLENADLLIEETGEVKIINKGSKGNP